MKRVSSVKLNIVMNFILTISNFIFPLITFPYVSRVLLPAGTGRVAFVTSLVSYFTMIGMLGIPTYGIRACAQVRDDKEKLSKTAQEIFVINSIAMGISLLSYLIALMTIPRMGEDRSLFLINIATLFFNLIGFEWLYKALEQYTYITIRSIILKFVSLVLMFIFVQQQSDYVIYGSITILASVGSNLFNFFNLRKHIDLKWQNKMNLKQHLAPILSFFMMTVATTIYTNLDAVMLGFMKTDVDVGYYNAAVKIKAILVSLVTSMGAVLLPRLSFYIKEKKENEFRELTIRSMQFVLFISIPLWIYFTVFAKEGIDFLSGNNYAGAILPMQIVMPTLFLIGISNLLGIQILVPMGREQDVLKSVVIGGVVDLILNVIFIPKLGASGAALGTLVAEFFVTLYQVYVLRDFLKSIVHDVKILKNITATAVASVLSIVVYLNFLSGLTSFWILSITALVFAISYLGINILLREEFTYYLLQNFKKKGVFMSQYDYLVVGSGLFGAVFAHEAAKAGNKVKVIEKRDHIAGNIYTKEVEGINIHEYGAHIFHTSDKAIWDYVNQFAEFNRYTNSPVANYKGEIYNLPFNMNTFNKLWGVVTPAEAQAKIDEQRAVLGGKKLENLEEQAISLVGTDIYQKLIKDYTEKQWGKPCTELPAFIIRRLPVRLTYDNNYFNDSYQGIPIGGYTQIVEKMLAHDNIDVEVNVDFFANKEQYLADFPKIVFTGMIDEFFDYQLGELEYRSLRFETETLDMENYQGNAVVNYTDAETPYTRIIEHKHFEYGTQPKTVITKEHSQTWQRGDEPYYPVNNDRNNHLYTEYKELAKTTPNVIFGGRLGHYRYYDMHQVIAAALQCVQGELGE